MKRSRLFKVILILVFLILSLSGCGRADTSASGETPDSEVSRTAETVPEQKPGDGETTAKETPSPSLNVLDRVVTDLQEWLKNHTEAEIMADIPCSGDLNGDGTLEYVFRFETDVNYRGEEYYLLNRASDATFSIVDLLNDNYSVGHIITGVDILQLDNRNPQRYVVMQMAHDATFASGYMIFGYDGVKVGEPLVNFPGATAYGERELKDSDNDGIYEHISYFDLADFQKHLVTETEPFNSNGTPFSDDSSRYTVKYLNDEGKFIYPDSPEQAARCFLEDKCIYPPGIPIILEEMTAMSTRQELAEQALEIRFNGSQYNSLEVTLNLIEDTETQKTYEVFYEFEDDLVCTVTVMMQDGLWKVDDLKVP